MLASPNLFSEESLMRSSTFLKNFGFGFAVTGFQDQLLENTERTASSTYNLCALTIGTFLWLTGCYLEKRQHERGLYPTVSRSTAIIQQGLSHACGLGIVASVTHFIKDVDTTSGKMAILNAGLLGPAAIQELTRATYMPSTIPWEKTRLLILIGSDYAAAAGAKSFINNDNTDPLTIAAICVGLFISSAETAYGLCKDRGLSLQSFIHRRFFKIVAGVNLIFTLLDIINLDNDKYTIADDVFCTLSSLLLFAALLQLRAVSNALKERYASLFARYAREEPQAQASPPVASASVELLEEDQPRSDYQTLSDGAVEISHSSLTPR